MVSLVPTPVLSRCCWKPCGLCDWLLNPAHPDSAGSGSHRTLPSLLFLRSVGNLPDSGVPLPPLSPLPCAMDPLCPQRSPFQALLHWPAFYSAVKPLALGCPAALVIDPAAPGRGHSSALLLTALSHFEDLFALIRVFHALGPLLMQRPFC